ncbi:MAG: sigma-70 family RNA polymerase sigma factor [Paludisphaera borealis]|uniref:sigma-70 family RNA polymerase sigma factor n=1 Tax=Paludisphaera borealis TaxID=1387353 RepID=UPI002841F9E1|nr:sigma-70 family RNA polymerase sigma factor [Paludisphaera borealis]MDR3621341.1 sigma-70 family RNA polymerase sigma factor [Paludisphaera borealis]
MMTPVRSGVESGTKEQALGLESPGPPADRRLLEAFLERDEASAERAFRRIVERHAPAVLRVCRDVLGDHHEAQDAAQAVFLVLARKAASIRRREALGSWLHGVSLRVARRARDAEARRRKAEKRNAEATSERRERWSAADRPFHPELHEELGRLPERYRLPIVLCYFEGYTQEEAARVLGWPYGTVQTRLHRGRRRLREALARRDAAPCSSLAALLGPRQESPDAVRPEWIEETARAAVRCAKYGGLGGSVSPSVSHLAATIDSSLSISTTWVLGICLAAGGVWFAGRDATEGSRNSRPPVHSASPADGRIEERRAISPGGQTPRSSESATADATPTNRIVAPSRTVKPREANPTDEASAPILKAADRALRSPRAVLTADGRELFERIWSPNDPRSHGGDGLGPVFNARSCVDCHDQGGTGGAGPSSRNIDVATADADPSTGMGFSYAFSMNFGEGGFEYRFGYDPPAGARRTPQASLASAAIHPGFREARSVVLHRFGADPSYSAWRGAIPGRHGQIEVRMSQRNPTPLFGVGLIDEIPDEAIVAVARRRSPGSSQTRGRVSRVTGGRIGRFGWKAQTATVEEFVLSAAAGEMGLEVPGRRQAGDPRLLDVVSAGLDMDRTECDALVAFVRGLPSPVVSAPSDPKEAAMVKEGEKTFRSIGCASCHIPKLGDVEGIYSDLLLHDMGTELGDSSGYAVFGSGPSRAAVDGKGVDDRNGESETRAREWRTPPLSGLRDSAPYLHDGRAETVVQAVILHGGQGTSSADRFSRLSARRKRQVEAFLMSLGAPRE